MPHPMRRALVITYTIVTIPWVGWFGYLVAVETQRHQYGLAWRYISGSFWSLLLVLIGNFFVYLVVADVVAVLGNSGPSTSGIPAKSNYSAPRQNPDYYSVLVRAICKLPVNTPEERHKLYDRARAMLGSQLRQRYDPSYIASERFALEAAILRVESEAPSGVEARL
jgi:hypothetical protein